MLNIRYLNLVHCMRLAGLAHGYMFLTLLLPRKKAKVMGNTVDIDECENFRLMCIIPQTQCTQCTNRINPV